MHAAKLSKDAVADAALRVLDDLGLPDLTMRRLATELGVRPSALYWHYPNKQTLLADVADRIVAGAPGAPVSGAWNAMLRRECFALRDALLAHRDSAELVSSTLALGLGENPALARLADVLTTSGFDAATVRRAASTMLHFLLGHVYLEQQRQQYAHLGEVAGAPVTLPEAASEDDFAFGVDTVIAGLRRAQNFGNI